MSPGPLPPGGRVRNRDRDAVISAIMATRADLARLAEHEQSRPADAWRLHTALGALGVALVLGERRWLLVVLLRVAWWAGRVAGRKRG